MSLFGTETNEPDTQFKTIVTNFNEDLHANTITERNIRLGTFMTELKEHLNSVYPETGHKLTNQLNRILNYENFTNFNEELDTIITKNMIETITIQSTINNENPEEIVSPWKKFVDALKDAKIEIKKQGNFSEAITIYYKIEFPIPDNPTGEENNMNLFSPYIPPMGGEYVEPLELRRFSPSNMEEFLNELEEYILEIYQNNLGGIIPNPNNNTGGKKNKRKSNKRSLKKKSKKGKKGKKVKKNKTMKRKQKTKRIRRK
jgi:hypothetical protein